LQMMIRTATNTAHMILRTILIIRRG